MTHPQIVLSIGAALAFVALAFGAMIFALSHRG